MEENIEEKLKSQLRQLELEHAVFERMVYKNKNQHRRCSYFHYLLKVRRDLRLLRTANMGEILRPCFHVISGTGTKQKLHVLESLNILDRLRGAIYLLSQMTEPILKAASGISILLACSFFIGSSVTFLALLARLRVLIQQILLDAVSVFSLVTSTSLEKQSAHDGVDEVFREFYPKDEECITLLDCVWKTDKYVLLETFQNRESSKPIDDRVSENATTTRDSLVQYYQTDVSPLGEDLSPYVDVTSTESSTPLAEAGSSKTNNGSQTEDSEKPDDESTNLVSSARIITDTTLKRATKVDFLPVKRPYSAVTPNTTEREKKKEEDDGFYLTCSSAEPIKTVCSST